MRRIEVRGQGAGGAGPRRWLVLLLALLLAGCGRSAAPLGETWPTLETTAEVITGVTPAAPAGATVEPTRSPGGVTGTEGGSGPPPVSSVPPGANGQGPAGPVGTAGVAASPAAGQGPESLTGPRATAATAAAEAGESVGATAAPAEGTSQATAGPEGEATTGPTGAPTTAANPTTVPATTGTAAPESSFQNPVLRADFPDPGVIQVGEAYYAYATNSGGKNVQVARSDDLVNWAQLPDAMPAIGSWAQLGGSFVWAPEVIQIGEQFVLYYTARDKEADRQCIGVATSAQPEGRFRDPNDAPLICQVEEGGSIDASPFRDADGRLYLYWKNDGNCCNLPTFLYAQELAPDGLSLVGEPVQLARNDGAWEGRVVEAPTMWLHDEDYYLFFSGNNYAGMEYAVGYATCASALGPCEDAPANPILRSVMDTPPPVVGPGHQTIIEDDDGETWMVYHAWEVTSAGLRGSRRFMWIDRLVWRDGVPVVEGPTTGTQEVP